MLNEMDRKVIGIDIGGTSISAGLIINGELSKKIDVPTQAKEAKEKIVDNLYTAIDSVFEEGVVGIGIGVPGVVDANNGIIYDLANIPSWKKVEIKGLVEKTFKIETFVGNDANCFVLGVKHFGLGVNYKNIVGLTLGTGLGAGIVIENKLHTGFEGAAGEFGLIPYRDTIIEDYCSGKFFDKIKKVSGEKVYSDALDGNEDALAMWKEYGSHLGQLVNIVTYTISPELIVFGGSVAQGYELFIDSVQEQLNTNILTKVVAGVQLAADNKKHSAILGAGALCY